MAKKSSSPKAATAKPSRPAAKKAAPAASSAKTAVKGLAKANAVKSKPAAAKPPTKPPAKAPAKSASRAGGTHRSTQTSKISKPPSTAIAASSHEPPEPPTVAELRKVDTGLTRQEREQYRKELRAKRAEILGAVDSLKSAALTDGGNLSNMPLHMADVGSDQYEQEAMLGLVESERRFLREIDEALHRIEDGTFGVCTETGKPIGKARLDIQPWAKYCIEVVRERERTGRR